MSISDDEQEPTSQASPSRLPLVVLLPILLWAICITIRIVGSQLPIFGVWEGSGGPSAVVQSLAADGSELLAGSIAGLYVSADGAGTWSEVKLASRPQAISAVYAGEGRAFAAGAGTLWERREGQWTALPAHGEGDVHQILLTEGRLLIAADEGLFSRDADLPNSWIRLWSGDGKPPVKAFSIHSTGDSLLLGTDDGVVSLIPETGAVRSLGLTGARVLDLEIAGGWVYAAVAEPAGGLLRTRSGAAEWQYGEVASQFGAAVVADPRDSSRLYAGLGGLADGRSISGVVSSSDGGATWTPVQTRLMNSYVPSLALAPGGGTVFAATNGGGVFRYSVPSPLQSALRVSTPYLEIADPLLLGIAALAVMLSRRPGRR